jgi:hypothetical protein
MHTQPLYDATDPRMRALSVIPGANHFDILSGRYDSFNRAVTAFCLDASR